MMVYGEVVVLISSLRVHGDAAGSPCKGGGNFLSRYSCYSSFFVVLYRVTLTAILRLRTSAFRCPSHQLSRSLRPISSHQSLSPLSQPLGFFSSLSYFLSPASSLTLCPIFHLSLHLFILFISSFVNSFFSPTPYHPFRLLSSSSLFSSSPSLHFFFTRSHVLLESPFFSFSHSITLSLSQISHFSHFLSLPLFLSLSLSPSMSAALNLSHATVITVNC